VLGGEGLDLSVDEAAMRSRPVGLAAVRQVVCVGAIRKARVFGRSFEVALLVADSRQREMHSALFFG